MKKSTRKSTSAPLIEPHWGGTFSTRFSLPSFLKRVQKLSVNQRDAITAVGFGTLLNTPNLTLNKGLLAELMERWNFEKLAFKLVLGDMPITLLDIAVILGLRVVGKPAVLIEDAPFSELEEKYGATLSKRNLKVASIESRLDSLGETVNDDFIISFLLFTFGTFLFPNTSGTVDSQYVYLLKDTCNLSNIAWGAAVLEDISAWLSKRKMKNVQYVGGCLLFLQIWSYEHIDVARPRLSCNPWSLPRVVRWGSTISRQRKWFESEFSELQENQITWNLQLSKEESNQDIVKELLGESTDERAANSITCDLSLNANPIRTEPNSKEHADIPDNAPESCFIIVESSKRDEVQPKKIKAVSPVVILDTAPESCFIVRDETKRVVQQSKEIEVISHVAMNSLNSQFNFCSLSSEHEDLFKSQEFRTSANSNNDDLKVKNGMLEEQIVELKKRIEDLEAANQVLQNQVSSGIDLKEKIEDLEAQFLQNQVSSRQLLEEELKKEEHGLDRENNKPMSSKYFLDTIDKNLKLMMKMLMQVKKQSHQ